MTDDIVKRLRGWLDEDTPIGVIMNEAADEITRLRNELHIAQEWSARVIAGHEVDIAEIARLRAALTLIRDMGPMAVDDQRWRIAKDALTESSE